QGGEAQRRAVRYFVVRTRRIAPSAKGAVRTASHLPGRSLVIRGCAGDAVQERSPRDQLGSETALGHAVVTRTAEYSGARSTRSVAQRSVVLRQFFARAGFGDWRVRARAVGQAAETSGGDQPGAGCCVDYFRTAAAVLDGDARVHRADDWRRVSYQPGH